MHVPCIEKGPLSPHKAPAPHLERHQDGQAAHKLGDEAELDNVRVLHVPQDLRPDAGPVGAPCARLPLRLSLRRPPACLQHLPRRVGKRLSHGLQYDGALEARGVLSSSSGSGLLPWWVRPLPSRPPWGCRPPAHPLPGAAFAACALCVEGYI